MEKTIYTSEYAAVVRLIRKVRREAKLTQVVLAERLGITQSQFSKIERGDRRLDVIELRSLCQQIGVGLPEFIRRLERELRTRS